MPINPAKMIIFAWLALQFLGSFAHAQEVMIPKGALVEIAWIAPPDSDVVAYRAFFASSKGDTIKLDITQWSAASTPGLSAITTGTISLPLGKGNLRMIAIDAARNKSRFSDVPALYEITDGAPGTPVIIRIKVL